MTEVAWLKDFSFNLKLMLRDARYSQRQFANMVGVSESTISKYVSGESAPSVFVLINMARVLDCDVSELANLDEKIER